MSLRVTFKILDGILKLRLITLLDALIFLIHFTGLFMTTFGLINSSLISTSETLKGSFIILIEKRH